MKGKDMDKINLDVDKILNGIGREWKDPELTNKVKGTPAFNSPEYFDRPHFVNLKWNEIFLDYPEYIINTPKDVVDISAGNGICLEIMRFLGHNVQGLDTTSTGFLNFPRSQEIPMIEFNGNTLPIPLPDKSFDLVISVGGIHHYTSNWGDVLDEFFRIARETVFISVTRGKKYAERADELDNHPVRNGWIKRPKPHGKYKFTWREVFREYK
jgi:SAM-dependent methyltransferase